jgi:hypothetical protein
VRRGHRRGRPLEADHSGDRAPSTR